MFECAKNLYITIILLPFLCVTILKYQRKVTVDVKNFKCYLLHFYRYADTMLHLFRGNIGSGLLAMGDAFRNGGIIFAPIMTAILGVLCVHAQHLLVS